MLSYLLRRLLASIVVLLAASFIVYLLAANAGDPLEDLRTSTARNKEQLIAARTQMLHLNVPVVFRYFVWLWGVIKGLWGALDLGQSWVSAQPVTALLSSAVPVTIQLLITSSVLAIVFGITIGIVTALRQYSVFDYTVTLIAFFLFSLPSFFIAVVLKQWLGIGFNDFLADPVFPWWVVLIAGVLGGVIWMGIIGGTTRRRITVLLVAGAATAVAMITMNLTGWLLSPTLTIGGIAIIGGGAALLFTYLLASFQNKRALYSSLTVALIGVALYYPFIGLSRFVPNVWVLVALGILAIAVGGFVGWAWGGPDRWLSARIGALTAFFSAGAIAVDRFMQSWNGYTNSDIINHRPISTIGSATANLNTVTSSFWVFGVDTFTHLILPTISIFLISLAGYSRYSRASLLEVMNQDYIRTARAKGLPERTVVVRHAFRNALIPLTTLVAFDFGGLVGGAIITENIFSWSGMGRLFNDALTKIDPDPIMGFFLVTGTLAIIFNLLADLAYSALDPRIRVNA